MDITTSAPILIQSLSLPWPHVTISINTSHVNVTIAYDAVTDPHYQCVTLNYTLLL